jgi:hypothetical protein
MQPCKYALLSINATLTSSQSWSQLYHGQQHQKQVRCSYASHNTACSEQCAEVNTACSDRQTGLLLTLNPLSLNADEEKATAIKRRSAFKLLTELLLVGVYTDAAVLLTAVKSLASVDFHRDREAAQSALALLASFAKSCREDILGLPNEAFSALSLQDADEV